MNLNRLRFLLALVLGLLLVGAEIMCLITYIEGGGTLDKTWLAVVLVLICIMVYLFL